jgi:hypothetical protein
VTRHLKASVVGAFLMVVATFLCWMAMRTGIYQKLRFSLASPWRYFIGWPWEPTGYVYWGLQQFGISTPDTIQMLHAYAINAVLGLVIGWAVSRIYVLFVRRNSN